MKKSQNVRCECDRCLFDVCCKQEKKNCAKITTEQIEINIKLNDLLDDMLLKKNL